MRKVEVRSPGTDIVDSNGKCSRTMTAGNCNIRMWHLQNIAYSGHTDTILWSFHKIIITVIVTCHPCMTMTV